MRPQDALWRFPSLLMAWRNLGRNSVRTMLAALGIVIGVVAIASLGITGAALQQQSAANLGDLTNEVTVSAGEDNDEDGVTQEQVDEIEAIVTDATVVPQRTNQTTVSARSGETFVSVTAVTDAGALYNLTSGTTPERLHSGALVSADVAEDLDLERGDPVEYDGRLYRVNGFVESEAGFGGGGNELVLPLSAMSEQEYYDTVTIIAADGDTALALQAQLEQQFNQNGRVDEEVLSITTFAGAQENIESFYDTLNLALLGIGLISLIVASVAILNVMLMSTIERRGEIGVFRAVGVRRSEVLRMILAEAAFLGVVGGAVGAVVSLCVGAVVFSLIVGDATAVFSWASLQYVVIGFGFAVVASVVSGIYPAWKAANERPVDALRS